MLGFQYKKAVQALNILANKEGGTISIVKAMKLLWLSDRLHLWQFGRTITGDNYVAMKYGPVASCTKDIVEKSPYGDPEEIEYAREFISRHGNNIHSNREPNNKLLSQTDKDAINRVYDQYGHSKPFDLADFSHLFPEWRKHEQKLSYNRSVPMDIADFFEPAEEPSGLFNVDKARLEASKEFFEKQCVMAAFM